MDSRPLPVETVSFTDRCAHRKNQSLAHLQCTHRGNEVPGKKGKKGQHLPAKTTCAGGKTKTPLCDGPTHQQRGRVCSALKNCVTTRTCGRPSVHVRCHCTDAIKNIPHAFARCVFELTSHLSRGTRHEMVSRRKRFSAQRQLVSYFTRQSFARCMQR